RPSPSPFKSSGLTSRSSAAAAPPPLKTLFRLSMPLNTRNPPRTTTKAVSAKADLKPHLRTSRQRPCGSCFWCFLPSPFSLPSCHAPPGHVRCNVQVLNNGLSVAASLSRLEPASTLPPPGELGCKPSARLKSPTRRPLEGLSPSLLEERLPC